jgi:hypothetical protein
VGGGQRAAVAARRGELGALAAERERAHPPQPRGQQRGRGEGEGEAAEPRVAPGHRIVEGAPGRREVARGAAQARDALADARRDRVHRARVVRAVAAAEAEQEAELVHLEQVGERGRVGARQQLVDVLVEPLARHVVTEELLLQRPAAQSASAGWRALSADSSRRATTAKPARRTSPGS